MSEQSAEVLIVAINNLRKQGMNDVQIATDFLGGLFSPKETLNWLG